jgi:DNA-binding MurR/RpiR family transcriptional regulator
MEVRIGVKGAPRELVLDSNPSADEIQKAIDVAMKNEAPTITLTDEKGRRIVVSTEKFAYVEIAETEGRRVGFGAI